MVFVGFTTLVLASVVFFCLRSPAWLTEYLSNHHWLTSVEPRRDRRRTHDFRAEEDEDESEDEAGKGPESSDTTNPNATGHALEETKSRHRQNDDASSAASPVVFPRANRDRTAVSRPPNRTSTRSTSVELSPHSDREDDRESTPKATAARLPNNPVSIFSLPNTIEDHTPTAPPWPPSPSTLMPPPPPPVPNLNRLPNINTATYSTSNNTPSYPIRPLHGPLPNRGDASSTLAPPPTHTTKPPKPSRAVVLAPGHSPLDWARLSGHIPSSSPSRLPDLRNLPPGTPHLRVPPSLLRRQDGRRGCDAWTVLAGRVYNLTPYLPFHPGGQPEILRCAGRDGTRLFGEVHPWVNYEGMLAACCVGVAISEDEYERAREKVGRGRGAGEMNEMD